MYYKISKYFNTKIVKKPRKTDIYAPLNILRDRKIRHFCQPFLNDKDILFFKTGTQFGKAYLHVNFKQVGFTYLYLVYESMIKVKGIRSRPYLIYCKQ